MVGYFLLWTNNSGGPILIVSLIRTTFDGIRLGHVSQALEMQGYETQRHK